MSVLQPGQLQLFMTPAEIKSLYQPLDADRAYKKGPIARGGEETFRARRTDYGYNDAIPDAVEGMPGYRRRIKDFRPEPVEETWARKATEAHESGLVKSVREVGVVDPVTLAT